MQTIKNILLRLTEKVERVNNLQHSRATRLISSEDWAELYQLTNEARQVLADTQDQIEIGTYIDEGILKTIYCNVPATVWTMDLDIGTDGDEPCITHQEEAEINELALLEIKIGAGIEFYDNKGITVDRFTVGVHLYERDYREGEYWDFYTMSENPLSPDGVNQYIGSSKDGINPDVSEHIFSCPDVIRQAVIQRLKKYLTEKEGTE